MKKEMKKKPKEKKRIGIKIFVLLIVLIFCIILYGRYIATSSFKVHETAIIDASLPSDYNGFKIAHFTDLHYGRTTTEETLKKVVKELNELNADIVIFTGDIFDKDSISENEKELIIKYFKKIKSKTFKLACLGDYDLKHQTTIKNILEESEFIVLDNESKLLYDNSALPLNFIGLTTTKDSEELYQDYFNITLIHKPDEIKNIKGSNLVFSGHSLAGQIRIPFIGGLKKIDGAETYLDTYYEVNNTKLYISNGIGTQDISFRTFNTPSITLYRLYNE